MRGGAVERVQAAVTPADTLQRLLGVDGVGPAAFVGSVIACCEVDTVLADNIAGLERFAAPAVRLLQARLAPKLRNFLSAGNLF